MNLYMILYISLGLASYSLPEIREENPIGKHEDAWSNVMGCWGPGGLILLVLVVSSGFTIIYASIPPYWIWGYWIS
jgi:hypothetical protein